MKRFSIAIDIWLLSFLAAGALVALAFARLDLPVARYLWNAARFLRPLDQPFGAAILLSVEASLILVVVLTRLLRGHISRLGETLAIACLASICAYGINSDVLKVFFGVPNTFAVMHGARHAFNLLRGSATSSFPSGHMVLGGAFAGVFMRLYRKCVWPLTALLLLAAGLLIAGDWHFVSDVIAGAFVGVSAGILAGEGWVAHTTRQP
jgi:membrane-associated phospholipid phosphatase